LGLHDVLGWDKKTCNEPSSRDCGSESRKPRWTPNRLRTGAVMKGETMTITDFLLARIAEDEVAVAVFPGRHWHYDYGDVRDDLGNGFDSIVLEVGYEGCCQAGITEHIARYDPARVLAECAAKRAIVQLHGETTREGYENAAAYLWDALYALASVYANHPDYRREWAL
jgi:hypothetical protein